MADNFDITADLQDGSFDSGETHIPNAGTNTDLVAPPGAVPAHGAGATAPEAAPAKQEENKPQSLREVLSNAFKEPSSADASAAKPEQAAQGDAPNAPVQSVPALTKGEDGKYRNADGTFASAEQIQAFEAANTPQAQAPQPPAGFTPLEAQQFQALPAELRQFVGRTMEALNTERDRYQEYGLLEQMIGPRREAWAAGGMTPAVAINQLLALSDFAGRDPGQFVLWMADQHGLDLDALLDERDAAQANMTPEMRAMQQQVQQLQSQIAGFTGNQQQAQQQEMLNSVQSFAAEADAQGNLTHPYFADVANAIPTFITSIRAQQPNLAPQQVLQHAYETACWANPQVRAKMQEAEVQRKAQEQAAKAASAKAASSSVSGGPSGDVAGVPDNHNRSLREELQANFAAYSN